MKVKRRRILSAVLTFVLSTIPFVWEVVNNYYFAYFDVVCFNFLSQIKCERRVMLER